MSGGIEEINCPICREGKVKVKYTPRMLVTHYSHGSSNKKAVNFVKDEKWVFLSGCPACKASVEDIKRKFNPEGSMSTSEAAKRAKEAGLPTKF